jgi:thymidylate synthase
MQQNKFKQIEEYYTRTLEFIQKDDMKSALKVIHNQMPVDLYDSSLDLLDNRNVDVKHLSLKELITMVHNLLDKESIEEEIIPDSSDYFINNQF